MKNKLFDFASKRKTFQLKENIVKNAFLDYIRFFVFLSQFWFTILKLLVAEIADFTEVVISCKVPSGIHSK